MNSVDILSLKLEHAVGVSAMPFHHRDPFDRIIISQSVSENIPLISYDQIFDLYEINRIW